MILGSHAHLIQDPSQPEPQSKMCYLHYVGTCPLYEGTPEELWRWINYGDRRIEFSDWLREERENPMTHVHPIQHPGEISPADYVCRRPSPCPLGEATPVELWRWVQKRIHTVSFADWLHDYRRYVKERENEKTRKLEKVNLKADPGKFNPEDSYTVSGNGVCQNGYYYPMDEYTLGRLISLRGDVQIEDRLKSLAGAPMTEEMMAEQNRIDPEVLEAQRFVDYPRVPAYEKEILAGDNRANYQEKALAIVKQIVDNKFVHVPRYHLYIVWFCKTLKNWKALVTTSLEDGMYYEVTYDGEKKQCYVDSYAKTDNIVVTDASLEL